MAKYPYESGAGSSDDVKIDSSYKLGIGITSPSQNLDVKDGIAITAASTAGLYLNSGGGGVSRIRYNGGAFQLRLRDDNASADRVTIDSNGNMGINVTDPDRKLEIFDGGGNAQLKLSYDGTYNAELKVDANGYLTITPYGSKVTVAGNLYATGNIIGGNGSDLGSSSNRYANLYMSSNLNYSGDLAFQASGTEMMRLTSGGLLGIGTTPSKELHIAKAGSGSAPAIQIDTYSATGGERSFLRFRKSHSNTLGTASQTSDADFFGSIEFYGVNGASPNAFALAATIRAEQDGSAGGVGTAQVPGCLFFETGNGNDTGLITALYISGRQHVGVGTTDPKSGLHIGANAGGTDGGYITLDEIGTTPTVETNRAGLFVRDNGSGKTQLCVQFSTGAVQVLATQP
jgi:hypothetical protein